MSPQFRSVLSDTSKPHADSIKSEEWLSQVGGKDEGLQVMVLKNDVAKIMVIDVPR